ncbi:Uncharacterized protein DAT39_009810, partial [Clarias magur]
IPCRMVNLGYSCHSFRRTGDECFKWPIGGLASLFSIHEKTLLRQSSSCCCFCNLSKSTDSV